MKPTQKIFMRKIRLHLLLADANVLIRLHHLSSMALLRLLREGMDIEIGVTDSAWAEVAPDGLPGAPEDYGVTMVRTAEDIILAGRLPKARSIHRRLSESDALQLLVAERDGWTLWTDDKSMREAADSRMVKHVGFFGPLIEAVRCRLMKRESVIQILELACAEDAHIRKIRPLVLYNLNAACEPL